MRSRPIHYDQVCVFEEAAILESHGIEVQSPGGQSNSDEVDGSDFPDQVSHLHKHPEGLYHHDCITMTTQTVAQDRRFYSPLRLCTCVYNVTPDCFEV